MAKNPKTPREDIPVPTEWASEYSPEDKAQVKEIIDFLNEQGHSRAWIGRLARVAAGSLSVILNGKYPSEPRNHLLKLVAAMETYRNRGGGRSIYIPTSVYLMAEVVCDRARKYRNFGVLTGAVGVGKTAAIKEYESRHPHTIVIEANPNMTPSVLLDELLQRLSAASGRSMDQRFRAVCTALAGTTTLLVIDEAETTMPSCLHYLRRVRDQADVGIVLAGTDRLQHLIKPAQGQFDQIRSRVGFWPATIRNISREDADALAQASLDDLGELQPEVLDALWFYCRGSARMLIENFIPALRDYGLTKHQISAELIEKIAEAVLFLGGMRRDQLPTRAQE